MSNEVAIQQALMRAEAALREAQSLSSRVAVLEAIWRAQQPAGAVAAPAVAAPAVPAAVPGVVPSAVVPLVPPAPQTSLPALISPWASLLGTVAQSAVADVLPALQQAAQQPGGLAQLIGMLLSPVPPAVPSQQPPQRTHRQHPGQPRVLDPSLPGAPPGYPTEAPAVPAAPAALQPGPGAVVSEAELDWLRAEGGAVEAGPVVAAQQTAALPPNYQHPPGVAPSPAPYVPVVPMPG